MISGWLKHLKSDTNLKTSDNFSKATLSFINSIFLKHPSSNDSNPLPCLKAPLIPPLKVKFSVYDLTTPYWNEK